MKIKNLAFYGVMAAILGSVGTARADGATDSTIIASKGYVDAYAQKQSDRVQQVYSTYTADANNTEAKKKADYPSMYTLEQAINGVDLSSTLNGLDLAQVGETGKPIVTVSQTDGQVAATVGQITTAGINTSALTQSAAATELNNATTAVDTKLPTTKAVATALADKEDVANKQAAQTGATVTRWDTTAASGTDAYTSDTMYPTVKAVAQQIAAVDVSAAVQDGTNALTLTDSATTAPSVTAVKGITDNTTTAYTTRDASTHVLTGSGSSTKVPTTAAVVTALKDLDMTELNGNDLAGHEYDYGKPVVQLSQVDGKVYGALGQVGTAGIMDAAVSTAKIANGAVTVSKMSTEYAANAIDTATNEVVKWGASNNPGTPGYADDAKVPTVAAVAQQIATSAVAPNPNGPITASTDHSIVTYNADGLVTGGISLPGLNDINDATTDAACTQGAPCVLSYYVNNGTKYYKWTNMDTEGLNAVNDSNS